MIILIVWWVVGLIILSLIDTGSFLVNHWIMLCITTSILMGPIQFCIIIILMFCALVARALNAIF